MRGLREHGVDVAALDEERLEDVVVAPHDGPRVERVVDRVDGRERLDVDDDRVDARCSSSDLSACASSTTGSSA